MGLGQLTCPSCNACFSSPQGLHYHLTRQVCKNQVQAHPAALHCATTIRRLLTLPPPPPPQEKRRLLKTSKATRKQTLDEVAPEIVLADVELLEEQPHPMQPQEPQKRAKKPRRASLRPPLAPHEWELPAVSTSLPIGHYHPTLAHAVEDYAAA
jgi:hypothetical protein